MTLAAQFLFSRALRHRQQATRARRLASTVPQDDIAARLLEAAAALEGEALRDEKRARDLQLPGARTASPRAATFERPHREQEAQAGPA